MHKQSGREIPRFSDDDVVDYVVLEAITVRALKEEEKAQKEAEKKAWKKNKGELREKIGQT